jgi:predicted deacylase
MGEPKRWHVDLPGTRIDEFPWRIHVHEFAGRQPGPATAILSGVTGDKPLGILAMHDLVRDLTQRDVAGTVLVIPCVNPYGFQASTRHNPDLVELNRRFPGVAHGLLSDQLAHAIMKLLVGRVDAVIDIHSGTAVRTTEYIYDYDNLDLSASFAYLPVMVNRAIPGQLCTAAKEAGLDAALVEFGGPDRNQTLKAVAGCLNMLRFRGHLSDPPTGPDHVSILAPVQAIVASCDGILESDLAPHHVGQLIEPGTIGWLTGTVTGERLEEYVLENPTDAGRANDKTQPKAETDTRPLLMLAQTTPSLVRPGHLLFMIGWQSSHVPTPRRT